MLTSPQLPLAVYREVAAHLRQIEGVDAGLIPRTSTSNLEPAQFEYTQSQVKGLWIEHSLSLDRVCHERLEAILDYYGRRYRPWQAIAE